MPPSNPPPPLRPVAFSLSIYRLRLVVPAIAVVVLAVGAVPGVLYVFTHPPSPLPTPQVPLEQTALPQGWTASSMGPVLAAVLPGRLPPPDPRQLKPPCAAAVGQEAINGYCWLRLDVKPRRDANPPCPEEYGAFEHNGKCYAAVLKAAQPPTSGEPQQRAVADP